MKIFKILITLILVLVFCHITYSQYSGNYNTSIHKLRQGKDWFYKSQNGGFEMLTNVPMSNLKCTKCHPGKLANGTPIDPGTYQPTCNDCHITPGDIVADSICFRCHGRQATEKSLYTDKHRSAGFKCSNCHTSQDIHGSGVQYNTMLDTTLGKTCQSSGCHTAINMTTQSHSIHNSTVECASCHARSEVSCYNCHFDSYVATNLIRRAHTQMRNFILLGRNQKTGKVGLMNFQALSYTNKSFYGIAPYYAHTIMPADSSRQCSACHDNTNIRNYNTFGFINIGKWDSTQNPKRIVTTTGVIPVPPNWRQALKFDYVTYTGRFDTTYTDPTKWVFLKSGSDTTQMLSAYAAPLTASQMAKLTMPIGINNQHNSIPDRFELYQNYPNPFNPYTIIDFSVPKTSYVTIKIFDILGNEIINLINNRKYITGNYSIGWDSENKFGKFTSSGLYFCNLKAVDENGKIIYNQTQKMILLK
ncbi:MAG TPA: hypothetical protein VJ455_09745 [Ignavibacteria bacterium]|nr:hypothetical protein [Ignavibacteria bacterium]